MLTSFLHALSGVAAAVKGERNMRIHLIAVAVVVALGAWFGLARSEWVAIILCCAIVISLECMNTAVEAAVDLVSPEIRPLAKKAKDCAAGAVLVSAIGAAVVGSIIFAPKFVNVIAPGRERCGGHIDHVNGITTNLQAFAESLKLGKGYCGEYAPIRKGLHGKTFFVCVRNLNAVQDIGELARQSPHFDSLSDLKTFLAVYMDGLRCHREDARTFEPDPLGEYFYDWQWVLGSFGNGVSFKSPKRDRWQWLVRPLASELAGGIDRD